MKRKTSKTSKSSDKVAVTPKVLPAASLADILGLSTPNQPKAEHNKNEVPKKWRTYYDQLIALKEQLEQTGHVAAETYGYSNPKTLIFDINAAIDRIFKGTYGLCELTHKPINPERLRAMPYTRYSSEGQKQLDEEAKLQALKNRKADEDYDSDGAEDALNKLLLMDDNNGANE
ncbi:MAG: TraR/DksA C4-type zinc finger protein [Opitutales bacterium]|nr:TraR/DksA C4-type zinc finger protein [Opitutales bacterium]